MSGSGSRARNRTGTGMNQQTEFSAGPPGQAPLDPFDTDIQSHIGRQLRALYDGVVSQPVPDRFLELLTQLEEKNGNADESGKPGGSTEGGNDKGRV